MQAPRQLTHHGRPGSTAIQLVGIGYEGRWLS
jgi:hypothetical protein